MKRKKLSTLIAIALPLSLVAGLLVNLGLSHRSKVASRNLANYNLVLAAYSDKDFSKAAELLAGKEDGVLEQGEGCELVISVYAEAHKFVELERFARHCISHQRADGISHEGLAYSLTSQGRIEEAIAQLRAEHDKKPHNPRLAVALARVYIMSGSDAEAEKLFLEVIRSEDSWSMWLAEILKQELLMKKANFVDQLCQEVLKKDKVFASLEQKLQEAAETLHLAERAQKLEERRTQATTVHD